MEDNKKPFRLRMNLFDGIVLVIILAVGLFLLWTQFRPEEEPASSEWVPVRYSVRLNQVLEGTSELIQPGDPLEYTLEDAQLGTVVSVESAPCITTGLDEEALTTISSVLPGYESVDLGGCGHVRGGGLLPAGRGRGGAAHRRPAVYPRAPVCAVGTITEIERRDEA